MEKKAGEEQRVIYMIIPPKSLFPEEYGMNHCYSVNDYGQQKAVSVSKPSHADRLTRIRPGASGKSEARHYLIVTP